MSLEEACKIAEKYFAENGERGIRQILDALEVWIFLPGVYGEVEYGGCAITLHKETGEIGGFRLPSKHGFELLKSAKEVEVPKEYIYEEGE